MVNRIDINLNGNFYDLSTGRFVLYSDYEALEAELKRVRELYAKEVDARIYAERLLANEPCTVESHKALEADAVRLREALEKIDVLCSDRQRIVMIGIQAFGIVSQITKAVLEASDEG